MIFSKPLTTCFIVGAILLNTITISSGEAYEMTVAGQTFQVNVVGQSGQQFQDKRSWTDDYGEQLDEQKNAICSSLRGEYCEQVTNNGAKTHNLFNYFPNHASESVVAHSNAKYDKNTSPYLLKQAMDDRTLKYLSRQNPNNLGNHPVHYGLNNYNLNNNNNNLQNVLSQITSSATPDGLNLVGSKKIKYKKKRKGQTIKKQTNKKNNDNEGEIENDKNNENEQENGNNSEEEEYSDVDVEIYANIDGDNELANALGLDEEEFGETVDRIVAQLVSSYLDGDSDEVDVSEIFANEMSVENGDVSYDQINVDQGVLDQMSEVLSNIAEKHKKKVKDNDGNDDIDDDNNEHIELFEIKFDIKKHRDNNNNDIETEEQQNEKQDDEESNEEDVF